ncbi:glycerol kinase GlpK [Bacillota bacterium Meth-B3]|nr:glycerol kinase GlpK [Christensenellaceae bacterium]
MKYIVALDQGTTSSRAVVFDERGAQVCAHGIEFAQHYPRPGWVEHNPQDILDTQISALREAVKRSGIAARDIAAIGITNQRETTLLWDKRTGACLHNAIVWQCRRTAPLVERLRQDGLSNVIRDKTGLIPDAYFSGTKLQWLLMNVEGARERAERGELCFGTVDSFLAWHLTRERVHVTDATNASRTMLFNLHSQQWDDMLLKVLNIPSALLPEVVDSAQVVGTLREDILGAPIPIAAMAGDQHAALFGQGCFKAGMVKNTYGTGCFMLMNTGRTPVLSENNLLTTLAWRINGQPTYALEGSVFIGGAVVQWLRDEMKLIGTAAESEAVAQSVKDSAGVYVVPAFAGLGAPHWDMYARGTIVGLTRGSGRAHIVRAALESIAYQTRDVLEAMARDSALRPSALRVDGGASANGFLMQFQADIADLSVVRPRVVETTALGAAMLTGRAVGLWDDRALEQIWQSSATFTPSMPAAQRERMLTGWQRAVSRAKGWVEEG